MKKSIFRENKRYTFSDYFEMNYSPSDIVKEFGYSFAFEVIDLPKYLAYDPTPIQKLQTNLYKILPKITLNSEIAKREFLIAPLLMEIACVVNLKINVEYLLDVDDKLNGSLDYFLMANQNLVIIEAKKKDIESGFNQLAVELIALDKFEDNQDITTLYGAVTLGDIWRFGILDRPQQRIIKNIHIHAIPEDIVEVFSILMGIFTNSTKL